jgi:Superinfection immunity protein
VRLPSSATPPNTGSVVVVNVLLGWTIVGWVVALAIALRDPAPGTLSD